MNLSVAFRFSQQITTAVYENHFCMSPRVYQLNMYLRNVQNERQMKTAMARSK